MAGCVPSKREIGRSEMELIGSIGAMVFGLLIYIGQAIFDKHREK